MTNLKNSPLVYALGMIQFPRIPDIEQFTDELFKQIRGEYPLDDMVNMPIYNANVGPEGIRVDKHNVKSWQFASVERDWGFVLSNQALCLHTSKYINFLDFSQRLEKGLLALNNIPSIGIRWIQTVGIRYVNIIAPPSSESLEKYLNPWVLPTEPPEASLSILEGAYISRYKTGCGELRLQAMRNPPFTLSPELNSPLIIKNEWVKERPSTDFALIDMDHSHKYEPLKKFEITDILNELSKLRKTSKTIFNSIGTDNAMRIWGG